MDKVSMQLALASAKASGDRETVRMIMSAMREDEKPKAASAEQEAAKPHYGIRDPHMPRVARVVADGVEREPTVEEREHVASMLQNLLGGLMGAIAQQEGSESAMGAMEALAERLGGSGGPRMLVIDGSTGEVVDGGEGVPPEVLEAIKAHALAQMQQGEGEDGDEEDEEGGFDFSVGSGQPPTKH